MSLFTDWYHLLLAASNHLLLVFFISVALSLWTQFKNLQALRVPRWWVRCLINCLVGSIAQISLLFWHAHDGKLSSYLILLLLLSIAEYWMSRPAQHQDN
jgi:hypothetical protein